MVMPLLDRHTQMVLVRVELQSVAQDVSAGLEPEDVHEPGMAWKPVGHHDPEVAKRQAALFPKLIEAGFTYHMDDYSGDVPFWNHAEKRDIVILPYALDSNDMKMWTDPAMTPDSITPESNASSGDNSWVAFMLWFMPSV